MFYSILSTSSNINATQFTVSVGVTVGNRFKSITVVCSRSHVAQEWMCFPIINGSIDYGVELVQSHYSLSLIEVISGLQESLLERDSYINQFRRELWEKRRIS